MKSTPAKNYYGIDPFFFLSEHKSERHLYPLFLYFSLLDIHVRLIGCFISDSSPRFCEQQKAFSRLISSILFLSYFFFWMPDFKKRRASERERFSARFVKKESMQIIPLNGFIMYADFFFLSFCVVYIFFIVYVNVFVCLLVWERNGKHGEWHLSQIGALIQLRKLWKCVSLNLMNNHCVYVPKVGR